MDKCFYLLNTEELNITVNGYEAENDDEITFDQGVVVEVIQKNLDGWWLIRSATHLTAMT